MVYVNRATKAEDRRVAMILCLHATCPQGYGTHSQRSGSCLAILLPGPGAHYYEPATLILSQCDGIFTDQSKFRYFSREIGQFQSTWSRFSKDKTMRPHVNMSTSCWHVNICPCLWLQLVTEVPVGIWIHDKFKLKIDRSVKTLWQEYGVVAGSWFHLFVLQ